MRFSAAAFVSALVVAFAILPFGLVSPLAIPMALLCGALASGLGAWLAGGGRGRLLPVLAASLASLLLAIPLGALLFLIVRTNLSTSTPIVFAVVAAASAFAVRRFRAPRTGATPTDPRSGTGGRFASRGSLFFGLFASLAVLAGLLVGGALLLSGAAGCGPEERAVFGEFPQYGGRVMEPEGNSQTGSCAVYYETPDSKERVRAYFSDRLRANGWKVSAPEPQPEATPGGEPVAGGNLLHATRGRYDYRVLYESLEFYTDPRPGVHLAVHVKEE